MLGDHQSSSASKPTLRLQAQLREPFLHAAAALTAILPRGTVKMGGGTVLAALWHHRLSTDLDFFMSLGDWAQALQSRPRVFFDLTNQLVEAKLIPADKGPDPAFVIPGASLHLQGNVALDTHPSP